MSFLNPLLLLGLLGASVPIIIHLIHKHRPRKQTFAALELLRRSIERVERRWRLKRFLLLAARVALLALFSLAAAGPLFGTDKGLIVGAAGPRRLGIVIDASLSMRARRGDSTSFARAVTAARNLIDAMGPEDQAVLVAGRRKPELLVPRPTASRTELYAALDRLEPSFDGAEMGEAVSVAAHALASLEPETAPADDKEAPRVEARVVVLSDLAGHAFQTAAELNLGASGRAVVLEVVDVAQGAGSERDNRALTALDAVNVPGREPRTVEVRTRVQSFTSAGEGRGQPADLTLKTDSTELERGMVDVVPGTVVDKVMRHAFAEPGFVPVALELEPDALVEDDVRYATVDVRKQVRTLVVDGAPSGVPKEDEIFYLERALAAGASDQAPPRVITPDDLPHTDLAAFDVVILAGVTAFTRSDGARLVELVERGGGLLITASSDMDLELYNAELGRVLPRPFRSLKIVDPSTGGLGADGLVTLASPALDHPVMEIFEGDALGGLLSTRTRGYLLLEPTGASGTRVLVEFEDGQPALLERRAGLGRCLLLTTSIDRDLTDLAIRPAFVPLVRRLVLQLGDALSRPDPRRTLVGEPRELRAPNTAERLRVTRPDGKEVEVLLELAQDMKKATFSETELPGHYQVRALIAGQLEPLVQESFAVNVDTRESDLRPITVEEATSVLEGTASHEARASSGVLARAQALRGLANPELTAAALLVLMALAFLLESVLTGQRIGR